MTAQQLCAPMALAKDLSLVLRTHVKGIPMTHNSCSRSETPLWHSCIFPHTNTHANTQLKNKVDLQGNLFIRLILSTQKEINEEMRGF